MLKIDNSVRNNYNQIFIELPPFYWELVSNIYYHKLVPYNKSQV